MTFPPVPAFTPLANPKAMVIGKNYRFTVLTDRILRLEFSKTGVFEDHPSQAFWYREQPAPSFSQVTREEAVEIETEFLHLKYRPTNSGFTPSTLSVTLKSHGNTWHYGDSDRKAENLLGTTRTLDMTPLRPVRLDKGLLSRAGWAVVDDSRSLVFNQNGWLEPRAQRETDLYFFGYGGDVEGCLRDFTALTGPIPMIPRFILGNWWSRYWAYTQEELQGLMDEFRRHEVPLSVCIVDMDWHITKSRMPMGGWTGYTWNRELFPDPPGFIHWLHEQGLRTALNLHPSMGVRAHEEQYPEMARWMGIDPATRKTIRFDLTDPRFAEGYFSILHHPQEEIGVDFWWMDWQQGTRSRLPGLDPLWWINHLHYYDLGRDGHKRPFVFSRWGGLGNHRYPIGFSGDTFIGWKALAFQPYFTATAANVAYGWWSHDIGGHMGKNVDPELTLRWVQFGVFSPIFRIHSSKIRSVDRRPWSKPERIYHAMRDAMQFRYALIPYIYAMAWRAHRTGLSLITPMYYGHMDEEQAFQAREQYFFGTELVAAPFVSPMDPKTGLATRQVWLPAGQWFNFFNGAPLEGNRIHTITGELEDIPVYAKAGGIVPLAPKATWGDCANPEIMDVYVFPGGDNRFELYEDDGESNHYLNGDYTITGLTAFQKDRQLSFSIDPVKGNAAGSPQQRTWRIHLRGIEQNVKSSLPGKYDADTRTLHLEPVTLATEERLSVNFTF